MYQRKLNQQEQFVGAQPRMTASLREWVGSHIDMTGTFGDAPPPHSQELPVQQVGMTSAPAFAAGRFFIERIRMSVHSTAVVSPLAKIDPSASIGPFVVIDGAVQVGAGSHVGAAAMILGNTEIGRGCRIHSHAVVGDVPQDRTYAGGESFCRIGEECIIREGATVHRGTRPGSATVIGDRCMLMTNTHVGHNCVVGNDVIIISGALLGGHVHVGAKAVIAGGAAIHQFVRIGELAMISGLAKVVQDVPPFFMTDRDGAIVGENRIGLMRAGLSAAERLEIKSAFRIIYRSGMLRECVLEELRTTLTTVAGRTLFEFMANSSGRGVGRESIPLRRAA